jgi:hypothetical protein
MEIFKEFKDGYEVSNLGNVKNSKGEILNLKTGKQGYQSFKIKTKDYFVHRVVLEVFNPTENMENKWVKRLNENKLNNEVSNLYWIDKPLPKIKKETKNFKSIFYTPLENESFLPVYGYEERYIISNLGNIVEIESSKKLYKGFNNKESYVTCNLYKNGSYKRVNVAKEVLRAFNFIKHDNYFTVHYLDNNSKNINIENLQWKSIDTRPIKLVGEELQELKLLEGEIFIDCYNLPNYQISNKGRLIHKHNRLIRKLKTSADGYKECSFYLNGKTPSYKIHRLVLMSFNPIEGMERLYVNHINHIRDDNRLENLEWVTPKENNYHSILNSNYRSTRTVGIKINGNNRYSINLNLGHSHNYEEAQKILFDACEKLNIDTKYLIREEF